ncbi:hypothetical protein JOQ06_020661, partial [Pogonophryne albipinna]
MFGLDFNLITAHEREAESYGPCPPVSCGWAEGSGVTESGSTREEILTRHPSIVPSET